MIKKSAIVINDFSGGMDTKTPIISMPLNKSPNMRNFHCKGVGTRLMKRGGFSKLNSSPVESDKIDSCYSPGYQTYDYPLRTAAAYTQIAQGFKPATTGAVSKIRLWLKKYGTPAGTDTITLEIQSDSSGVPSGTEVTNGVATAVDISDTTGLVTTGYSWVTFTFTTAPTLTAGTQYHLVLYGAYTLSGANYITWGADNYDVIYPDGSMSVNDATTWVVDTLYDACFEVYIAGGVKGNDGIALWDFSSKNMLLGIFGTSLYKMDKNSAGDPDGIWDAISGGTAQWDVYTKLMLHCDGIDESTTITDETGNTVTAYGHAQIDTAQKKWGTGSIIFDGVGDDYVSIPDSVDFELADSDFSLELQVYFAGVAASQYIMQKNRVGNYEWALYWTFAGAGLVFAYSTDGTAGTDVAITFSWSPSATTWYHIMLIRNGANLKAFIDGVQIGATYNIGTSVIYSSTNNLELGAYDTIRTFNGQMDEIRISKGIARQVNAFTPPVAAYSASSYPITSSRYWTMADWQSGRALINTDIGLYTYTGTGSASAVTAAPVGKFFIIWKNYAFCFGIRDSPNNGQYSALSDYTTWPAANTFSNAFNTNDGDVITGVRMLKGKLYVFKRYSIFRITYLGSNPAFQVDQVSGRGTPSHYTIKEVDMGEDLGTVLIFLTTDKKLAIFDGYNIQVISDVLTEETNDLFASADDQPLTFSDINLQYADLFHAVVKADTQEYILYCVLGTDTAVNYAFVFDYKTGGVFPYDGQIFASSVYALATNKVKKLYCSGYTGYTWLQEDGNSDDSSSINAYWVSGKVKLTGIALLNKNLLLGINVKEITSSSTINIAMQYRFDWNVSWHTAQNFSFNHNDELAFGKTVLFDIGSIENMLQVKLKDNSTNPAPTIYSLELYGDPIPLGISPQDRATS